MKEGRKLNKQGNNNNKKTTTESNKKYGLNGFLVVMNIDAKGNNFVLFC